MAKQAQVRMCKLFLEARIKGIENALVELEDAFLAMRETSPEQRLVKRAVRSVQSSIQGEVGMLAMTLRSQKPE